VYAYTDITVSDEIKRAGALRVERRAEPRARASDPRACASEQPELEHGDPAQNAAPRHSVDSAARRSSERESRAAADALPAHEPGLLVRAAERACAQLSAVAAALRDRLAPRRRRFRQLQHTNGTGHGSAIKFTRSQLPSSGEITVESDRAVIREIEGIVRERFVQHAILSERLRYALDRRVHSREFALDFKQIDGPQLPLLADALRAEDSAAIATLSLRGNLFGGGEVRELVGALVTARSVVALCELRLGANVHLGMEGVRALGAMLAQPGCQLRVLRLDGCALSPACGHELSAALEQNRALRALDLRDNALDDDAVLALMAARATMQTHGLYLDLSIQGNPISSATYQLVALTHYSDSAQVVGEPSLVGPDTQATSASSRADRLGESSARFRSDATHDRDSSRTSHPGGGAGSADAACEPQPPFRSAGQGDHDASAQLGATPPGPASGPGTVGTTDPRRLHGQSADRLGRISDGSEGTPRRH
jgi:hypothetical protein